MSIAMRVFEKEGKYYRLENASRDELLTLRNDFWVTHYQGTTNQFGQKLKDEYQCSFYKEYAIIVDDELKSRGLNPKDKNYTKQDVTR